MFSQQRDAKPVKTMSASLDEDFCLPNGSLKMRMKKYGMSKRKKMFDSQSFLMAQFLSVQINGYSRQIHAYKFVSVPLLAPPHLFSV